MFLDENTFTDISHFIHPAYIHDKMHTTLSHLILENIMTSCISYIMTLHTTDVLPFQERGQSKDDYYQLSLIPDSIPVSSQGISVSDLIVDATPVSSQGISA